MRIFRRHLMIREVGLPTGGVAPEYDASFLGGGEADIVGYHFRYARRVGRKSVAGVLFDCLKRGRPVGVSDHALQLGRNAVGKRIYPYVGVGRVDIPGTLQ